MSAALTLRAAREDIQRALASIRTARAMMPENAHMDHAKLQLEEATILAQSAIERLDRLKGRLGDGGEPPR